MQLKDRIIHESLRLFSLKGYAGTSIDDILQITSSSKGGFYNHFKTKDDLFFHVLEEAIQIWRERNLTGLGPNKSPLTNVKIFLQEPQTINLPGRRFHPCTVMAKRSSDRHCIIKISAHSETNPSSLISILTKLYFR